MKLFDFKKMRSLRAELSQVWEKVLLVWKYEKQFLIWTVILFFGMIYTAINEPAAWFAVGIIFLLWWTMMRGAWWKDQFSKKITDPLEREMWKLPPLWVIVPIFLLSSCMTVGRIQRNCDEFAKICVTEKQTWTVYRDTTIFRTDTVKVKLPADTVTITDTVRIVNNLAYLPPVHRRFGLIGVDAAVNRSILDVKAYLVDSTILVPFRDTIIIEKAIREEKQTALVPVRYIPGFYKFCFYLFVIQALLAVAFLLFRQKNKGLKAVLSVFQKKGEV